MSGGQWEKTTKKRKKKKDKRKQKPIKIRRWSIYMYIYISRKKVKKNDVGTISSVDIWFDI